MGLSNLPPGVTNAMIENAWGANSHCECCGRFADDCICPECPVCQTFGEKNCYIEDKSIGHGLKYNAEQLKGQTLAEIADLQQRISDLGESINWLEQNPNYMEYQKP